MGRAKEIVIRLDEAQSMLIRRALQYKTGPVCDKWVLVDGSGDRMS